MPEAAPMFDDPVYQRIWDSALPFLQTRANELHTRVSLRFAQRLLEGEGGDAGIVLPAVLLHDVGWSRVPEELLLTAFGPHMSRPDLRDLHEREGAAIAGEILAAVGYLPEKVRAVVEIVSRHDSRPDADCLEEAIVKDADKLWRCSREGFRVDAERFGTGSRANLGRLEAALDRWFLTPTGRRLAGGELEERRRECAGPASGAAAPSGSACRAG